MSMTYEDMSMSQLKSLAQDKGLGTGRSKQELIDKLVAYDNRDITATIKGNDEVKAVEPKDTAKAEVTPQDEDPSPTVFRISFSHSGMLLDSDHENFRRKTYSLALSEGLYPYGNPLTARLIESKDGQLTYEIEVHG